MVDKLEAMLARWPILLCLLGAACSVGATGATIVFLNSELHSTKIELAVARLDAHDAKLSLKYIAQEFDVLRLKVDRLEGNAQFRREPIR